MPVFAACTVTSRQSAPTSSTLRWGGADGRVLLAAFSTTWKSTHPTKTVGASRTPTKGQEPGVVQTRQNSGFVRSLVKRVGTVAYISNGVKHTSAVQYGSTASYVVTINHFPDKKSGRGGWERRGALAGFYGNSHAQMSTLNSIHWFEGKTQMGKV